MCNKTGKYEKKLKWMFFFNFYLKKTVKRTTPHSDISLSKKCTKFILIILIICAFKREWEKVRESDSKRKREERDKLTEEQR